MKKSTAALIRNRIVGHEEVAPDQLLAHPSNFRRHPGAQLDALRDSLAELGWFKSVLVSKRTGTVIDGHARVEEAIRQNLPTVPVEYVDLTEAEEKLALAIADPISEMAIHDEETLAALLEEVSADGEALQAMLDEQVALSGARPANKVKVEEVDLSEVNDSFWMTVRGPLPAQLAALEKLRDAMAEIPGVEVEIGTGGEVR